jgi:glycosyltransferase involved in cell wall biosynthesis
MKIFYLDPNNNTPQFNYPLLEMLTQKQIDVTYYSTNYSEHTNYYDKNYDCKKKYLFSSYISSIKNKKLRLFFKFFSFPFHYLCFCFQLIIEKPDIIHINWLAAPLLDYLLLDVARILSVPTIVNVHNFQPHDNSKHRFLEKKIYAKASELICFSDFICQKLKPVHSKVHKINHGNVYQKEIGLFKEVMVMSDKKRFTFLFLGGIRAYKGLEILLKAISNVQHEIEGIKLIIAGSGDKILCTHLQKLIIFFKIEANVEFLPGYVTYKKMIPLVQACDCGILPYQNASQSGVVYLYNELEKPLIVTNVGGLPEQVEEKVSIVCLPNAESIAEAIKKMTLFSTEIKKADFQTVHIQNDFQKTARAIEKVYADL